MFVSLSAVNSAPALDGADSAEHTTKATGEFVLVRTTADQHAEAARLRDEQFKAWFSSNLQNIKSNPNHYTQLPMVTPSQKSKDRALSYVNKVTGKYLFYSAEILCACTMLYSLYAYYSQSCALPMITKGNYSHSIGESAHCKITPDVFPVFYAIAGGSVTGVFNSGLNYYNTNWLNAKPYAFLAGAYVITILVYNFDTHKLVVPVVYPICGGLTLSWLLDLIKIFFTIPPKPNPIKKISTDSVTVDNAIDLIARLIEYMEFSNDEEITDYLYAN
ncbi:MAG: hypothetical protein C0446_14285 [Chitinophaga sp.]|nr:hypothetical protein [Chitinophaga sp.]